MQCTLFSSESEQHRHVAQIGSRLNYSYGINYFIFWPYASTWMLKLQKKYNFKMNERNKHIRDIVIQNSDFYIKGSLYTIILAKIIGRIY